MKYVEMTIEEAMVKCRKSAKVLVAIQDLTKENEDIEIPFVKKKKEEYDELFDDAKTVSSLYDDFVHSLNLYTVKQDIYNVKPKGLRKIVLLE